ncbi:MAG: methyltransferase [Myxococcota bacterium]|nr:methyltransferase [Myxococcota bacterium]
MPTLYRPLPMDPAGAKPITRRHDPSSVARGLLAGRRGVVADHYSTGAEVLAQLRRLDPAPPQHDAYAERQAWADAHRAAALRLLAPIRNHQLALGGARPIGFLEELYPDIDAFHLPFLNVQELHAAWGRYRQGIHMPVLGHKVHPYFHVYAPRRMEHLEVFGTWLSSYGGRLGHAIDVGTGSGVLALMLARKGFARVTATDNNPNAVRSVRDEVARIDPCPPVRAVHGDLFAGASGADLVVFNPPWTQGRVDAPFDAALHAEPDLLPRFFHAASDALAPGGRIVVLYSNISRLLRPDDPNPLEEEMERGRFQVALQTTRRLRTRRNKGGQRTRERIELWVFEKT